MAEVTWAEENVLVTGASGVLGFALLKALDRAGCGRVHAVGRSDCDLLDAARTTAKFQDLRPTLVVHMAAKVHGVMGNMKSQGAAYYENCVINTNVVEATRLAGARKIVAMGTTAIYSDAAPLPKSEDDVWIGAPHHSEAGYAHAKRGMLAQLEAYRDQYGLEFAYCIATNLFGPGDRFDEKFGHVVPSLISRFHRCKEQNSDIEVWGTGVARRDFLYAGDAARAICLIAEQGRGPINLASGRTITIKECVEEIARAAKFEGAVVWDRSKPDGQLQREYDLTKLKSLGFKTMTSFEAAIKTTYDWYAANAETARR
jgi:GDP-L-fucose synthase